MIGKGKKINMD